MVQFWYHTNIVHCLYLSPQQFYHGAARNCYWQFIVNQKQQFMTELFGTINTDWTTFMFDTVPISMFVDGCPLHIEHSLQSICS